MLKKRLFGMPIAYRMLYIMVIAFIIRALAVYFLNLTPQGDYAEYLTIAHKINNNILDNKLYFGIFPHSLNYPIFISWFYKIFGEATWLPRAVNMVLGVIEAGFAVYIMEKAVTPKVGVFSGLAVALNPSIIVFTLLSGAEPVYAALIMCSLFFMVLSGEAKRHSYLYLASAGILCAFASFFRPTGIILIIAILIQIIVIGKQGIKDKLYKSLTVTGSFLILSVLTATITSSVSGYEKPTYGFGWNLYIGANETSVGKWNEEDAAFFNKSKSENNDPSKIQKYFAELGMKRYRSMGIDVIKHFYKKLSVWTEEKFTTNAVTEWQTAYTRFKSKDSQQTYSLMINLYNTFVMFGAVIAMLYAATRHASDNIKTLSLYIMGSMLLYMVLETASRYKGAYYGELTLLAVYGFGIVLPHIKNLLADKDSIKSYLLRPLIPLQSKKQAAAAREADKKPT